MDDVVDIVQDETSRLIDQWTRSGRGVRPTRGLSLVMLRTLGRFIFGFDFEAAGYAGKELHSALIALTGHSVVTHLLGRVPAVATTGRAVARGQRFFLRVCRDILQNAGDTPFMVAIRAAVRDGDLTEAAALDEIKGMLAAGHETSATAVSWCVAMLAEHPELVGPVIADAPAAAEARTFADVRALVATDRWCKESLRMYPPVPLSVSQAVRDTTLGRLRIPRGTRVDVCSYVMHMMPAHWDAPEQFNPARFATTPSPGTYLPFLMGGHVCLGKHLAMVELPIVTARLAAAFTFALPHGPPQRNLRISLHPKGFVADVHPRTS